MATVTVEEAFAFCEARVRSHYENFPVGLWVPREKRPYVHALYAYARAADDFADEPMYEGMRAEKLDQWEQRLHAAYEGRAEDPIFIALGETVRRLDVPKPLLLDLLSAFRQDTVQTRYETWDELLDYCRRSADPVGRLVLIVFGYREPSLPPLSDAICTGLQLANHWQDLALDLRRGRLYAPRELRDRFGVKEWDLNAGRVTPEFHALMQDLVARTRALFARGRPLCDLVGADLRFEMRLTWLGGSSILDAIERAGHDVFRRRPRHGLWGKARLLWRAWRWTAAAA
ncbi:MAG TPA: squalene synthase HpnC [Vicinamibacteria bacterium]|nr:squalene synthase HpnC [Vicinamibacteria bacterium]